MAPSHRKISKNSSGRFTIDDHCIGCALCIVLAPSHFSEDLSLENSVDTTYVRRQPQTDEEITLCQEARWHCPVDAIGEDGLKQNSI